MVGEETSFDKKESMGKTLQQTKGVGIIHECCLCEEEWENSF